MALFIRYHLLLPMVLFVLLLVSDAAFNIDQHLTDLIYAWQGHSWYYQHHWLTESVIHSGGRLLVGVMLLALFVALLSSFRFPVLRPYRASLGYLTVAIIISFIFVNGLKAVSGVPCPWDVINYGGKGKLLHWFNGFSGDHGCFPAGHASGGYVWVALYFFSVIHAIERRYHALAVGIGLGLIFGVAQQVRGAHFLSHDIVTLAICWFTSAGLFLLWFGKTLPELASEERA